MSGETGRHLPYLDGWRGCAIGAVLMGHFWLEASMPGLSVLGVTLFFVLSGRLMAEILFVREASLPRFYIRRFSRVYPALAFFVLACAVIFHRFGGGKGYPVGPGGVVSALTFTVNYAMLRYHTILLFDHLWSLCVEEHGYVLLSLVALAWRRHRVRVLPVLGIIWLAAVVNGVVRVDVFGAEPLYTLWRSDVSVATIVAAAAAHLALRGRSRPRWSSAVLLACGVGLAIKTSSFLLVFGVAGLCLAISVALLDQRSALIAAVMSWRPLGFLGRCSFSLYLWQQPFYKMSRYGFASLWVLLPIMVAAVAMSYRFVELPARRRINAWFDRKRSAMQGATAPV